MTIEGTVVDGVIVRDGTPHLPEGTWVRVEVAERDLDDTAPPPTTETREELLASLRESIEEAKSGHGGVNGRPFLNELAQKLNLPPQPGESGWRLPVSAIL